MKRKAHVFLLAGVVLLAAVFVCIAVFGRVTPKGRAWTVADGYAPFGFPDAMEFFDDDMCSVDGFTGMYQIKKGRLTLIVMGQAYSYSYSMPGEYTLILHDGVESVKYVTEKHQRNPHR